MGTKDTRKLSDVMKAFEFLGLVVNPSPKGGSSHISYAKKGMTRPAVLQKTHKEVPLFILANNARSIGIEIDLLIDVIDDLKSYKKRNKYIDLKDYSTTPPLTRKEEIIAELARLEGLNVDYKNPEYINKLKLETELSKLQ